MSINVDDVCPLTPEIEAVAIRRADEILKEFGRLCAVWGTGGLPDKDGGTIGKAPTLRELAVSCYAQGVRDAIAVTVVRAVAGEQAAGLENRP